jgi:2-polyprenyl-3-methyl-5-hydroxy-6-metoxy-1,4-benzoquinol methylase
MRRTSVGFILIYRWRRPACGSGRRRHASTEVVVYRRWREGWHCLELGGGNGSIAEWLGAKVGPLGSVTTIDVNPVLLELIPAQNLSVQQMDVRTGELRPDSYDLVTCRA